MLPFEVPSPSQVVPGYMDRTLTLDVAHYLRHSIFRWNRDQYVHMVWTQSPFQYLAFSVRSQFSQHWPQLLPQFPKQLLLTIFRYPHDVVLAIPSLYGINYGQLSCRTSFMLNFERFTKVRFYILFPELSNSACLPGIAGGLPRLISSGGEIP